MTTILAIFDLISGYKTYIAAVGLFGLAVYQATQGDFTGAYHSLATALGFVGVRHAVAKATVAKGS